jgi:hypothetical protein
VVVIATKHNTPHKRPLMDVAYVNSLDFSYFDESKQQLNNMIEFFVLIYFCQMNMVLSNNIFISKDTSNFGVYFKATLISELPKKLKKITLLARRI